MSQPPGYGWFMNSPGQARFPGPPPPPAPAYNPVGQAYYPGVSQSSRPDVNSVIGWQQGPPLAPDLGFGGFNSAPMATGAAAGGYGFGFGAPTTSLGPAAPSPYTPTYPEPSAPLPSVPSAPENRSLHPSEDSGEPTNSGPRFVNVTSDSKPARPPPPEIVPATNSTPKPNPSSNKPNPSDGEDHRNTSQYKEALQNMAALMTDVDLTDDVMNDLKQRFDLK